MIPAAVRAKLNMGNEGQTAKCYLAIMSRAQAGWTLSTAITKIFKAYLTLDDAKSVRNLECVQIALLTALMAFRRKAVSPVPVELLPAAPASFTFLPLP